MNLRRWGFRGRGQCGHGTRLPALLCIGLLAAAACRSAETPERDGVTVVPDSEPADVDTIGDDEMGEDTLVMQAGGQLSQRPEAPLRIEGACPFECCRYGTWTTTATTTVYEEPDESAASFTIPAGTTLEAASGYVLLTTIGVAVARDTVRLYDESGGSRLAAAGDTLLVLDEVGEGYRRVWHAGAIYQTDAASGFEVARGTQAAELVVEPDRQWWARVRTEDGHAGWLWMDRTPQMEGADACS